MRPAFTVVAALLLASFAAAQPPSIPPPATQTPAPHVAHEFNFEAERAQANTLYVAQKPLEALPLYEDLCRQDSTVAVFAERHASGLFAKMATIVDPKEKQAIYNQGMAELRRAQTLGDNSQYVLAILGSAAKSPVGLAVGGPMGALPLSIGYTYTGSAAAKSLMQQAESAFGHNDMPAALKFYQAAAAADPAWYDPAVFAGDTCFRLKDYAAAATWFAKAIAIDPDRETAFRYAGDALYQSGDAAAARTKFEQAIVAEPYGQTSWVGLRQLAQRTHNTLVAPRIVRPDFTTPDGKLAVDPALASDTGDGRASWVIYQQHRVGHGARTASQPIMAGGSTANGQFTPNGYVHTLAEEMDALNAMLLDVHAKLASGAVMQAKLDPSIKLLLQLEKDNMLEPFILLSFNDAGIRHGYPDYRSTHRDQLVAYIDRYMIAPAPSTNPPLPQP